MEGKVAREVEDADGIRTELQAAEALAGLSCRSKSVAASSSHTSQDPATAAQSNPVGKFKQSSNEVEKEAKKLRRIQANRESARESIRRKQAMYVELTRKATYLSEENENLKKEMEQAMVTYNSLKDTNQVLKEQMMKVKKAEPEDSQGEPNSNNPPTLLYNQPSLVPCLWPSIHPSSSNIYPLHCALNPSNVGSSQFLVPDQGLESSTPVFLVPISWMFPVLTHTNNIMPMQQFSNSNSLSSSETMPRLHHDNEFATSGVSDSVPATEHTTGTTSNNDRETLIGPMKQDDASGAVEARRKRKELMNMKKTR